MTFRPTTTRTIEQGERISVDSSFADKKGRVIGAAAQFYTFIYSLSEQGSPARFDHPVGTFYAFRPSATRNGGDYGATQCVKEFASEAARDVAARAHLASVDKRAATVSGAVRAA